MIEICAFTIMGYAGCKFILAAVAAWFIVPAVLTGIVVLVYTIWFFITNK